MSNRKLIITLIIICLIAGLPAGCKDTKTGSLDEHEETQQEDQAAMVQSERGSYINPKGKALKERFQVPQGFIRVETDNGSFGEFLQNLPLKPDGSKVLRYDGQEKTRDVYLAVVDYTLGNKDLQQCADAVIRLRAEFLYAADKKEEIGFHFVSGFKADFSKWAAGYGISVHGNEVSWTHSSSNNSSYESFEKYLDVIYSYCSTLSLEKELVPREIDELSIGDVFIRGGSPGHCVIVVDMAENPDTGEKVFILAQSYMPAQDIQILRGNGNDRNSPWYSADITDELDTPEWRFEIKELRTWERNF